VIKGKGKYNEPILYDSRHLPHKLRSASLEERKQFEEKQRKKELLEKKKEKRQKMETISRLRKQIQENKDKNRRRKVYC
jgi:hypothetical protein